MDRYFDLTWQQLKTNLDYMQAYYEKTQTVLIIGICITAIIGIAILWNQRKLKKQLRQLQEMLEEKEDKPE